VPGALLALLLGRRYMRPLAEQPPASDGSELEQELDDGAAQATASVVSARAAPPSSAEPKAVPRPDASATLDEVELMLLLRSARGNDPKLAAELAREGNRRFPDSSDAPERASILIHSLAEVGLSSEARGEAEDMVNRYPDSTWVREIERFTGAHRRRNVRVDEQGQLRYTDPPAP
jgi:hypothetical protein